MLMQTHENRLAALRKELARGELDGFVIPIADEHMSEYVGEYAQRLAWLTGFGGSAGTVIVLADTAAIFIDGRYTEQVKDQVDERLFMPVPIADKKPSDWLAEQVGEGARIGFDPWLHTRAWVEAMTKAVRAKNAQLLSVDSNPVDAIWSDRPARPDAPFVVHPDDVAGQKSAEKRANVTKWLAKEGHDAVVIAALDSVAWLFNIRGGDVANTPVGLAYSIVEKTGAATLFAEPEKLTDAVRTHLGDEVATRSYGNFSAALSALAGKSVAVDPDHSVAAIFELLDAAGATVVTKRDPTVLPKAIKNNAEIAGHRAAQARDGAALTRFLKWFSEEAPKGGLDELSAAARLQQFREDTGVLLDLSFRTISATGAHGALPHYSVDEETNAPIEQGQLYLVDSGGQYRDGTTDVTRVAAVGTPSDEMRLRYTQVLKGHIALAQAVFPKGTSGGQLDILARQYLWADGVDFAHGTGHGVGSYLSVHEGPQRIGAALSCSEPLKPGMIISNEPGYYKAGEFGIRIENLVLVEGREIAGAEQAMFGFETLTFAPLERELIEVGLLSEAERQWVDGYHARVLEVVGPQLDSDERAWLETRCASL